MKKLDFHKIKVRRDCIGKEISWCKFNNRYLSDPEHPDGKGIVLEVAGKNVLVDKYGSTDWLWASDLIAVWLTNSTPEKTP